MYAEELDAKSRPIAFGGRALSADVPAKYLNSPETELFSKSNVLYNYGRLYSEPEEALRVYTRQCSVGVSAVDLAIMGATLANEGVNPITNKRVMDARHVPELLAVMAMTGFYDESGAWQYTAGLPAKTGVGGGIVTVVPGKFAIVAFSPRLNESGNSIRAMKAIRYIAGELGVGLYGSNPD